MSIYLFGQMHVNLLNIRISAIIILTVQYTLASCYNTTLAKHNIISNHFYMPATHYNFNITRFKNTIMNRWPHFFTYIIICVYSLLLHITFSYYYRKHCLTCEKRLACTAEWPKGSTCQAIVGRASFPNVFSINVNPTVIWSIIAL